MNVSRIADSAWMNIAVRFVLPALMTLLMTIGTYEISSFRNGSTKLEGQMMEISTQINQINKHLVERDGEVKLIHQMLAQMQRIEDDHEARIRALEKGARQN